MYIDELKLGRVGYSLNAILLFMKWNLKKLYEIWEQVERGTPIRHSIINNYKSVAPNATTMLGTMLGVFLSAPLLRTTMSENTKTKKA